MWILLPWRHLLLLSLVVLVLVVVVVVVVVMVVVVIVQVAVVVVVKSWLELLNNKLEARASKYKFGPRDAKNKFGAWAGKSGARDGKNRGPGPEPGPGSGAGRYKYPNITEKLKQGKFTSFLKEIFYIYFEHNRNSNKVKFMGLKISKVSHP